jgi:hypothetical protein
MSTPRPAEPTSGPPHDLEVLAAWAPELAETFAALACDIALVVDPDATVRTLAQRQPAMLKPGQWTGHSWLETARPDSKAKLERLMDQVRGTGRSKRSEVNHTDLPEAPLAWRAVALGRDGPILAIGHDQRAQTDMQQRFLSAQEALERSYWNAQRHLLREPMSWPSLTAGERRKLGLAETPPTEDAGAEAADALKLALDRLQERIGKDSLQDLLRDARRVAEQQFLSRALQRAGSVDALAQSLGVSRRALIRRGGAALRPPPPAKT